MKYRILGACIICLLSATPKIYGLAPKPDNDFYNVINKYINSIVTSDYKELRNILDEKLLLEIPHLNRLMIFNKTTFVEDIKSRDGTRQDFKSSFVVLAHSDAVTIVKVDFKYGNTVMQNFVFLEKNQDEEWKICHVYELFELMDTGGINLKDSMAAN